jgi:hypothetical protein
MKKTGIQFYAYLVQWAHLLKMSFSNKVGCLYPKRRNESCLSAVSFTKAVVGMEGLRSDEGRGEDPLSFPVFHEMTMGRCEASRCFLKEGKPGGGSLPSAVRSHALEKESAETGALGKLPHGNESGPSFFIFESAFLKRNPFFHSNFLFLRCSRIIKAIDFF